jgi:hypothetical protein
VESLGFSGSEATNGNMSIEITWGDTVIVSHDAPSQFHPGFRGSVSGIRDVVASPSEPEPQSPTSARLYLVEFSDGTAIEIPEHYLSKEMES